MVALIGSVALRVAMLAMVVAVLRAGRDDPRFAGKGIGIRFTVVALPATLLVPAVWWRRCRDTPYPASIDALYLSVFALDLAGNVFDWYDTYKHFDLIPHAHGGGAITILFASQFRMPTSKAVAWSIAGHALLEAQEIASDKAFGLHNVRGWWDVVGDLGAGVVGAAAYAAGYEWWVRDAGSATPQSRSTSSTSMSLGISAPSTRSIPASAIARRALAGIRARSAARRMKSTMIASSKSIAGSNVK
jgi:hypothetical protein